MPLAVIFLYFSLIVIRESMLKEAKSHAKLKHANIVQYHTSWLESPPLGKVILLFPYLAIIQNNK